MKLHKGQILKRKEPDDIYGDGIVEMILDGGARIKYIYANNISGKNDWYTDEEIEKYFELPKEKWEPDNKDYFYHINSQGCVECGTYLKESVADSNRKRFGNIFRTKEEAEAAAVKIKELLANL